MLKPAKIFEFFKTVSIISIVTALLLELVLRIYNPIYIPIRADQLQLPVNRVFTQRNTNNPKVDEFQTYTYNGIGLKGPEFPDNPSEYLKIITVGGSTTACVQLSDGRTWPDRLLSILQAESKNVWLNNAGQDGHSTFGHLILLERHLQQYRPDIIIYLVGINDVGRDDINDFDAGMIGRSESLRNRIVYASELLSTLQVLKRSLLAYDLGVNSLAPLDITSLRDIEADSIDAAKVLDLHKSKYLPQFRARLEELVDRTANAGAKAVLMTQPALYGSGVDPFTNVVLDNLEVSGAGLPSVLQWRVLELYNDVTREVAAAHGLNLIDLAQLLRKDSALFFDWIHYSNLGAEVVAELVADALLEKAVVVRK